MSKTNQVRPDLEQAKVFLDALELGASFTYQTFPEGRRAAATVPRASVLHGPFGEVKDQLVELNAKGHGVFVMVNEGDCKGRKTENVIRVRALFVDLDGAPLEPVMSAGAKPDIVVESSPDRWHAYWLVDVCPLEDFKPRQHQLAAKFKGDPSVCDLPRVMRIPGFLHLKESPFLSRLITPEVAK